MKDKKTIEMKTGLFEVKLYWNGPLVSLHLTALFSMFIICLFIQNESAFNLFKFGCLIDIIGLVIYAMSPKKETGEDKSEDSKPIEKEKLDVEVNSKKADKGKIKEVKDKKITNKVPVPNPGYVPRGNRLTPPSQPNKVEEVVTPNADVAKSVKTTEMSDWSNFFGDED